MPASERTMVVMISLSCFQLRASLNTRKRRNDRMIEGCCPRPGGKRPEDNLHSRYQHHESVEDVHAVLNVADRPEPNDLDDHLNHEVREEEDIHPLEYVLQQLRHPLYSAAIATVLMQIIAVVRYSNC